MGKVFWLSELCLLVLKVNDLSFGNVKGTTASSHSQLSLEYLFLLLLFEAVENLGFPHLQLTKVVVPTVSKILHFIAMGCTYWPSLLLLFLDQFLNPWRGECRLCSPYSLIKLFSSRVLSKLHASFLLKLKVESRFRRKYISWERDADEWRTGERLSLGAETGL